ncbi:MAG: hypothetical protein WBC85_09120 [Planktotalea sp.]|uniref:DUF6902 family protein n=1 Tax=Planktotalea sp. TaxID=2029877 RepID=UPI003C739B5A
MSDNVVALFQHFKPETNSLGALAHSFSTTRRDHNDVYWLKENSELLNILECTHQEVSAQDIECYRSFYQSLPDRLAFFPQYYRFLTSIALDLEALGMEGTVAQQLCHFVDRQGLAMAELSDLQRAEAQRLLARRDIAQDGSAALSARLHEFMDHTTSFAIPNRKAAYELTHIVFYLSEYGRRDPELSEKACKSLLFTGILAHLEENADLLAEVCVALRYAGRTPPKEWERWVETVVQGFDLSVGQADPAFDNYHEYLVANWACAEMGAPNLSGVYSGSGQTFLSPVAPLGAMRAVSETLFELRSPRLTSWDRMERRLTDALPDVVAEHLKRVASACPEFSAFFEHFSRTAHPSAQAHSIKQPSQMERAK